MFVLSQLRDILRLPPVNLSIPLLDAMKLELHKLFLDKVVKDLGLCVSLYDVLAIEGGNIAPGDGAPTYTVDFRLVMFRPFIGEVLIAKLEKSDKNGLKLSLGFFDDIFIPDYALPQPSTFNEAEGLWVWIYEGNEMFFEYGEDVRFKVTKVKYPPLPLEQEKGKAFAPMEIIGDVNADGLGLLCWW